MYYCKSCGGIFSQPDKSKNGKYTCPECGSKRFEQAQQCQICKEFFVSENKYDKYCDDCKHEAVDYFKRTIEKWIDPDYIELLRDEYSDLDYIMGDGDANG